MVLHFYLCLEGLTPLYAIGPYVYRGLGNIFQARETLSPVAHHAPNDAINMERPSPPLSTKRTVLVQRIVNSIDKVGQL